MENKTESYIILKPISERFNKIAKEMSDDEIKNIIKSTMSDEIRKSFNFSQVAEIVENCIEENEEKIQQMALDAIKSKMKF